MAQLAPALLSFAQWAYKIILKGGGTIAGASAYYGSLLSNKGLFDGAKLIASATAQGLLAAITLGHYKPRDVASPAELTEAKNQFNDAKAPWQKASDDLAATIKAAQDQLKNPVPPPVNFQTDSENAPATKEKVQSIRPDLTNNQRIGAFSMPSQTTLIDLTRQIVKNTDLTVKGIREIIDNPPSDSSGFDN